MRRRRLKLGLAVIALLATACRKGTARKDQALSADAAPAPDSVQALAASDGTVEDPGRCVTQVIVQEQSICFEFNRGYYWCRGGARYGERIRGKPGYHLLSKHYRSLFLGEIGCGQNADNSIECWSGFDSGGMLGNRGAKLTGPTPVRGLPGPVQQFALFGQEFCVLSAGKVFCPAALDDGSPEVRGVESATRLGKGYSFGFGCAANNTRVWCWGADWIRNEPPTAPYSARLSEPISLPSGLLIKELVVGTNEGCVLATDHRAFCFGNGGVGAWGDGTYAECDLVNPSLCPLALKAHPVLALGANIERVAGGAGFFCALKTDHSIWCWGDNGWSLVNSTVREVAVPRDSGTKFEPVPIPRLELGFDNRNLMVKGRLACVEKNDGALWCWGDNDMHVLSAASGRIQPPTRVALPAPRCPEAR